ncbi:hypothetical protein [Flavobacterium sp.]|jgi:hypothetical protein|uniref:hypothetical protein n=1 Tax=Flavobacterium sp. TaxID=239 RepID=UPI0037C0538E
MNPENILSDNLNNMLMWNRCLFMTHKQYKNGEHFNDNIYYHRAFTDNIQKHIHEHIKGLAEKLPFKTVPKPIYILIAKHIQYDKQNSLFDLDCKYAYDGIKNKKLDYDVYTEKYKKDQNFNNYLNDANKNKKLQQIREHNYDKYVHCFKNTQGEFIGATSDLQKYTFIYDNINSNRDKYMSSSLSPFTYQGLYEVIIYIPNLNKGLQYFSSFKDFSDHNRWMNMIIGKNSKHLNIIPIHNDVSKYPFISDLTNICLQMGCSSEYGEDFDEIIPKLGTTSEDQKNNAIAKGPYYPTKCLKTDYYKDKMIVFEEKNKVVDQILTDQNIQISGNIIDQMKSTFAKYRNESYDGKYSQDYNENILTELALRKDPYPGIQEIIFPVFILKDDYIDLQKYTHFLPWGNLLLTNEYVLNDGDKLDIEEKSLKSFDNIYELKFETTTGYLSVFKDNRVVSIFIANDFRKYTKKSLILQNGALNIYGYEGNNNDNRYSISITTSNGIWPISLVLENSGILQVYDNGMNKIRVLEYEM